MTHPHPTLTPYALGEAAERPPCRAESCFTFSTGDCHPALPFPGPVLPAAPSASCRPLLGASTATQQISSTAISLLEPPR